MPLEEVLTATATNTASNKVSVALPASPAIQADDQILIAFVAKGGTNNAFSDPTGDFAPVVSDDSGTNISGELWRKKADGDENGTTVEIEIRQSGNLINRNWAAGLSVIRGADPTTPILTAAIQVNGFAGTCTAPSLDLTGATGDAWAAMWTLVNRGTTVTQDADYSETDGFDVQSGVNTTDCTIALGIDTTVATSGTTGTQASTLAASAVNIGIHIILNEATGGAAQSAAIVRAPDGEVPRPIGATPGNANAALTAVPAAPRILPISVILGGVTVALTPVPSAAPPPPLAATMATSVALTATPTPRSPEPLAVSPGAVAATLSTPPTPAPPPPLGVTGAATVGIVPVPPPAAAPPLAVSTAATATLTAIPSAPAPSPLAALAGAISAALTPTPAPLPPTIIEASVGAQSAALTPVPPPGQVAPILGVPGPATGLLTPVATPAGIAPLAVTSLAVVTLTPLPTPPRPGPLAVLGVATLALTAAPHPRPPAPLLVVPGATFASLVTIRPSGLVYPIGASLATEEGEPIVLPGGDMIWRLTGSGTTLLLDHPLFGLMIWRLSGSGQLTIFPATAPDDRPAGWHDRSPHSGWGGAGGNRWTGGGAVGGWRQGR